MSLFIDGRIVVPCPHSEQLAETHPGATVHMVDFGYSGILPMTATCRECGQLVLIEGRAVAAGQIDGAALRTIQRTTGPQDH